MLSCHAHIKFSLDVCLRYRMSLDGVRRREICGHATLSTVPLPYV